MSEIIIGFFLSCLLAMAGVIILVGAVCLAREFLYSYHEYMAARRKHKALEKQLAEMARGKGRFGGVRKYREIKL